MRLAMSAAALLAVALSACGTSDEEVARHRAKATEYYEAKQWNEAKIELVNVINARPEDGEAHFLLGDVLFNLEEYRDGLWQIREAVRLDSKQTEWRMRLAQVMFAFRLYDDCAQEIDAVLEADPRHIDALLLRAALHSIKGEVDAMLADVDTALEIDPKHKAALAFKAQVLGRKGDLAGAEEYLRKLLEVDPTTENHLSMARFLATLGRHPEALAESRKAIEVAKNPDEKVMAQLNLANQHLNLGELEATFEVLQKAREEFPDNAELLLSLARLHHANGQRAEAEALLEEHVKANPEKPEPLLVLADYYRIQEQGDKAIEAIDRALVVAPGHEPALLRRAEYLHDGPAVNDETRKESWDIVESVLQKNPRSSLGHFTEGKFHLLEGEYEKATNSLRRVLDDQPSANAHVLMGNAYQRMDQNELARSEFQSALQLDAQNLHARVSLAGLYLGTGENELAVREARIALRLAPGDARTRMILATGLTRLDQQAQAREALEPLGDGKDQTPEMRYQLAQLYRGANDLPTARKILEELIDDPKLRTAVQGELIACDVQARKPTDALARLDGWIEAQPDQPELYLYRGRVRLMLTGSSGKPNKPEEIERDLRTALDKGLEGIQGHLMLAAFYVQSERVEEAIATLQTAQKRSPNDTEVPFQLAGLFERQKRLDEARQMYEEVLRLNQDQPVVKNNLAWLLVNSPSPSDADLDRALELAQSAKEALPNNPSVADTLGWVMYKKQVCSAAISLFHEAIAAYPEAHPLRGTVRYHLAHGYECNGEVDRAISELMRALEEVPSFAERKESEAMLERLRAS
jgi:tetratricopeptide (TPR) repeat protein